MLPLPSGPLVALLWFSVFTNSRERGLKHVWGLFCERVVISRQESEQKTIKRVSITSDYRSKMTKVKKEKVSEEGEEAGTGGTERSYQELIAHLNPIAQPLASKKLSKKLYKCVKKGEKKKNPANGREMLEITVLWRRTLFKNSRI